MSKHYHVLSGLRGCFMPDANETFATLDAANEYADSVAEEWDDDDCEAPIEKRLFCESSLHVWYVGQHYHVSVSICDNAGCEVSDE